MEEEEGALIDTGGSIEKGAEMDGGGDTGSCCGGAMRTPRAGSRSSIKCREGK